MGSDPIVPECNGLVIPFDTDLQVLTVSDMLHEKRLSVSSSNSLHLFIYSRSRNFAKQKRWGSIP